MNYRVLLPRQPQCSWTPHITTIDGVCSHGDTLDVVTVNGGMTIVVPRAKYPKGARALFIPEGYVVPDIELFASMWNTATRNGKPKYKLGKVPEKARTVKLRCIQGVWSRAVLESIADGLEWDLIESKKPEVEASGLGPAIESMTSWVRPEAVLTSS